LFGILIANVRQLMLPFDLANLPLAASSPMWLVQLDWLLFMALVDLKFLTVFSLLFGIGFALQIERMTIAGTVTAPYLRRLFLLLLFGVAHGLLLYPADVLTPYALAGVLLLSLRKLSAQRQLLLGVLLLGLSLLWGYQIGALSHVSRLALPCAAVLIVVCLWAARHGWRRLLRVWTLLLVVSGAVMTFDAPFDNPKYSKGAEMVRAQTEWDAMQHADPTTVPRELELRRNAGFPTLFALHVEQYTGLLIYTALLLLWRTLGLFLIGSALYRLGVFDRLTDVAHWQRVAIYCARWGLPLSLLAAMLMLAEYHDVFDARWPSLLHHFAALPMAVAIGASTIALHASGRLSWLWRQLQSAGRMPLSNYLGQSLLVAFLAEGWGLREFGHGDGPQLSLLALMLFLLLLALSRAWLHWFRMGPLEWLWRLGSYARWLPLRR
jgi:uncharacterized protein